MFSLHSCFLLAKPSRQQGSRGGEACQYKRSLLFLMINLPKKNKASATAIAGVLFFAVLCIYRANEKDVSILRRCRRRSCMSAPHKEISEIPKGKRKGQIQIIVCMAEKTRSDQAPRSLPMSSLPVGRI